MSVQPVVVGRERELAALRARWAAAGDGRGGVVLLTGEAGIGKTCLAEAVAAHAGRHAEVLWGRCQETGGAPPGWPWVQILRQFARRRGPDELQAAAGGAAGDLARMVPEFGSGDSGSSHVVLEPRAARFRLCDRIVSLLLDAAQDCPLMVVLEDLHWSDPLSLAVLQLLAPELARSTILLVATFRDDEVGPEHPLTDVLLKIGREVTRLALSGWSAVDVDNYINLVTDAPVPGAMVVSVHTDTAGNPLFVSEVVRLLAAEGRLHDPQSWRRVLPPTVAAVIGRRLARVSATCRSALGVAAVLGREVDAVLLERVVGAPVADALDEGVGARLLVDTSDGLLRYRFAHALVQQAVYDGLAGGECRHWHHRAAQALEASAKAGAPDAIDAVAAHYVWALPDSDPATVVDRLLCAAQRASGTLAHEEAARLYEVAREVVEMYLPDDHLLRCDVLLHLGEAQQWVEQVSAGRATLRATVGLARRLGSHESFARAALALAGSWPAMGVSDREIVELLSEATERAEPGLRARLLARWAIELYFADPDGQRGHLSEEALTIAEQVGDHAVLADVLAARHWVLYGPDHLPERLEIADRMLELAVRAGDSELALHGYHWRITDLLDAGDVSGADVEIGHYAELAERLAHPIGRWQLCVRRAMRALLDGRFADAEQLAMQAHERGVRLDPRSAAGFHVAQRFALLRERGGLDELASTIAQHLEAGPNQPGWGAILAAVHIETGRPEEARRLLQGLSADRFRPLNRDYSWLGCMVLIAEVCAKLGEVDIARMAYPLLLPYADRAALLGRAGVGLGSVSRPLGVLAALIGRPADAERHFQSALVANARMGAAPFVAHTAHAYADLLEARGGPGDSEHATALRSRARAIADELGMTRLSAAVRITPAPAGLTRREVEVLRHIAAGRSNQQIADTLVISLNTVLRHVSHILAKTGCTNRTQAAQYATRHGMPE